MNIVTTLDGSHTLYVPEIDEHYHSVNGALQESRHIFIQAGLNECLHNDIRVLEVGFGTGLNAFLTLINAEETLKNIIYTTIELHPVTDEFLQQLNYADHYGPAEKDFFKKIHDAEWGRKVKITDHFTIEKLQADFVSTQLSGLYDVIFFDAFSPEKQPELWSDQVFKKIYDHSAGNAIITTYCAKGAIRRSMQQTGFTVERLPGPPGKREMLRGKKMICFAQEQGK